MGAPHMIRKILIANRGEIASRIARTCRKIGVATVALYTDVDQNAPHVKQADEAVHLPAGYLHGASIIAAAQHTGADAIHPGYGFLSENADFAQAVNDAGLIFIGPTPAAIRAMGSKQQAKQTLKNVPLLPGYVGDDQRDEALMQAAEQIGYPVMVKAAAGGGGKGMREVEKPENLPDALAAARREAQQAFGDDTLTLEKRLRKPRHIEIQILGDQHGNIIALGERECSIQRRYQKIIEEAPCPVLTPETRAQMSFVATDIGRQLGYENAGTVEFLLDSDGEFYFMEMNTRLQVEHPVTEMVYNTDIVHLQILIAEGHSILDVSKTYEPGGHAIEARIYAEDPTRDFLPATGTVLDWHTPAGIDHLRIDSGIETGSEVTVHYDPMLAKVIVWSREREYAIRTLDYALSQIRLLGLRNNIHFLRQIIKQPAFLNADLSTNFVDEHPFSTTTELSHAALIAAALHKSGNTSSWRNNPYRPVEHHFQHDDTTQRVRIDGHNVQINDQSYTVTGDAIDGHRRKITVAAQDDNYWVHLDGSTYHLRWLDPLPAGGARDQQAGGTLRAPMPGQIIKVLVQPGEQVTKDALLLTLEAMKMEHRVLAPYDGTVETIYYAVGDNVPVDAVLLDITPTEI